MRAYTLPRPVTIANTLEYAGCKSWVPLTEAVATEGARAVIGDEAYRERTEAIKRLLRM